MTSPVFYDASGGRWRRFRRAAIGSLFALSALLSAFSFTILALPASPAGLRLTGGGERRLALPAIRSPARSARVAAAARASGRLRRLIASEEQLVGRRRAPERGAPFSTAIGFYASWDPAGLDSLRDHADALTYVMPQWLGLGDDGASFIDRFDPETRDPLVLQIAARHGVRVIPMLDNAGQQGFRWNKLQRLLESPEKQRQLAARLRDFLVDRGFAGINLDLEPSYAGMSSQDADGARALVRSRMPDFVAEVRRAFAPRGLLVTEDVPAADESFDYARLGELNDLLVVMLYDEHVASGQPGPIASQPWIERVSERLFRDLDPSKTVLGLGNYACDWPVTVDPDGTLRATRVGTNPTLPEALELAASSHAAVDMDEQDRNPRFGYVDATGQDHVVYMLDATTAYNEVLALAGYEPAGAALWHLGSEDPTIWSFFAAGRLGRPVPLSSLGTISFDSAVAVDPGARGEVMEVTAGPRPGRRVLSPDGDGLVESVRYEQFPRPYVLSGFGAASKEIALTFDDGPDPVYTREVLDVLQREKAPATFFVIGEQAEGNLALLERAWRQGCEIGNHTFTHPHIAAVSPLRAELELNATQRLIESAIGRSTRLFRPPYGDGADVNATTPDDATMLLRAQRLGYVTVGMNIDPKDYTEPGVDRIVRRVLGSLPGPGSSLAESRNVVLLHDGGGDRSETVAALPGIIDGLRARGYRLVTVSQLLGPHGRQEMFPAPTRPQESMAGLDRFVFEVEGGLATLLGVAFVLAIALGVGRILLVSPLALAGARRERRRRGEPFEPPVTVIVPAYNEAKVIERTIATALASDYPAVRVVVVDDGSTDETEAVLARAVEGDPRVTAIRKANGGKAEALNLGLEAAETEIVVCVDADTVLAKDAIRRLVAPLADPRVGAVAGNVKVGNRRGLLPMLQSVEYVTSQGLDRRAYSALGSVPIVPGALGAWRRKAVLEAGGYEPSTLAEDTDLTFKVRLLGYRTVAEPGALAYTEVPEDLRSLTRQRFRWSFGVLQALWKHRKELFRPRHGAFAGLVMPSLWLFNVAFQALAPLVDAAILVSLFTRELWVVATYGAVLFTLDLGASLVAYLLDGESPLDLGWLLVQRLFYRQLMYYVLLRAVLAAIRGRVVGWGKLQRRGTAVLPGEGVA